MDNLNLQYSGFPLRVFVGISTVMLLMLLLNMNRWWWYHSLMAHEHQKGHTVPKQVIMIATSIQVATV